MKEIWKTFSTTCKNAWTKTLDALSKLWNDFVEEAKGIMIQLIDFLKDLFGNTCKLLETIIMGLALAVVTALFEAIYDSIMYGFDALIALFKKDASK